MFSPASSTPVSCLQKPPVESNDPVRSKATPSESGTRIIPEATEEVQRQVEETHFRVDAFGHSWKRVTLPLESTTISYEYAFTDSDSSTLPRRGRIIFLECDFPFVLRKRFEALKPRAIFLGGLLVGMNSMMVFVSCLSEVPFEALVSDGGFRYPVSSAGQTCLFLAGNWVNFSR